MYVVCLPMYVCCVSSYLCMLCVFLYRKFILLLRPHSNLFHSSVKVHVHNGSGQVEYFSVPRHEFFEGVVSGEKKSTVHAHINNGGILTASIIVQDEHYHIEVRQKC